MLDICAHIKAFIFIKLACNVLTTMLTCDFIFSFSPPPSYKTINIQGGVPFLIHKESAHPRRRHVFLRRSCMFLRRRGAPFGPPHRVSHKCYAFPRRSCGVSTEKLRVSTEKMRVSTEKLHISTEKRLSVTEQRQYSTEKFDFHGITTHLYGEGASFYGEGLARMYVCMYEILFKRKESIDASLINYSWFP